MTINAPVHARIIHPDEVHDLVMSQHYSWVWGERKHVSPPTHDDVWNAGMKSFSPGARTVTFMVALDSGNKQIDFIEGYVTGVRYESGAHGMLLVEMRSTDPRWTKVHGFYDCRNNPQEVGGWLSLTPRR